jgi:hypothetical protein
MNGSSGGAKLLETGVYCTIEELAVAEKINSSYVSRILRLTQLAPDIVEAILTGNRAPKVTLTTLMQPFSTDWPAPTVTLGVCFQEGLRRHILWLNMAKGRRGT